MAEERIQRRLAAILAADVVGYSRLMEADEEGMRVRLRSLHAELIDPRIAADGGRIVKTTGDGILVEFPSAVDAVRGALDIQGAIRRRNADLSEETRIEFRVGINVGDVIVEGDDIHGEGVNVAARLEGLCGPGEVYVSGTVHDHVEGKLAATFDDLGEQTVKNIAKPVRVYRAREVDSEYARHESTDAPPLPDKPSIAVLPFENMSGDPEQEYFADGVAEDIITGLSRFRWFFVIARNSTFTYKGRAVDVKQVAQELGVQYVLEGSVRKAGDRVRITAQLVEATTGRHVWADRYDRELHDIFALQDEITEAITSAVAPEFVSAEARRTERKAPESFDAWDYTMRGNWHLWRINREDIAEARELFHKAIKRDPNSAVAYSGLAAAYNMEMYHGWAESRGDAASEASRAAEKAVALDDRDAWAHAVLGFVRLWAHQQDDAIKAARRAIDLNPNLASAEGMLSLISGWSGAYDETMLHADKAERLSPRDPERAWWSLGRATAEFVVGRYDEAVRWAKSAIEVAPSLPSGWRMLAASYAYLDRLDEARAAVEQLRRLAPQMTIEISRATVPAERSDYLEKYLQGLREAGLPE